MKLKNGHAITVEANKIFFNKEYKGGSYNELLIKLAQNNALDVAADNAEVKKDLYNNYILDKYSILTLKNII